MEMQPTTHSRLDEAIPQLWLEMKPITDQIISHEERCQQVPKDLYDQLDIVVDKMQQVEQAFSESFIPTLSVVACEPMPDYRIPLELANFDGGFKDR